MVQQIVKPNAIERRENQSKAVCPSCGHQGLSVFYEVPNVPVHSCLMLPTQEEALNFPCDDVMLGGCERCGFITNTAFNAKWSAYASNYEDQQSFSPTFNQFALGLAQQLIDKYDLNHKNIIEIGCSKGDFLLLLCELGNNRGVGIDPSVVPGRVKSQVADRVRFIPEYYGDRHAQYVGDFICCRHTLEHIHPTAQFLKTVRRSIGNRTETVVCFEIPDTVRVLDELAFEDIYYEHCSYFTPGSLARLFRTCGFEVTDLYKAYADQYLLIEAVPVDSPSDKVHPLEETVEETLQLVRSFAERIPNHLLGWQERLAHLAARNKRVAIWGSGSKCVAFLTTLKTTDSVQSVVDINPHRHGKFIPGVGKQIQSPDSLRDLRPDAVIVMNSIYRREIQQMLDGMGLTPEIMTL